LGHGGFWFNLRLPELTPDRTAGEVLNRLAGKSEELCIQSSSGERQAQVLRIMWYQGFQKYDDGASWFAVLEQKML
jgi:hypothetical protein